MPQPDPKLPSLRRFLWMGSTRFCLAGGVVFATVAFGENWLREHWTLYGAYLFWTALFILLGGVLFKSLVLAPNRLARSYGFFGVGFFLYAAAWVASYFSLGGLTGECLGSLLGPLCMAFGFQWVLKSKSRLLPKMMLGLVVAHTAGYFLGRPLLTAPGGRFGMIAWGLVYGFIFGAGLGYALFTAQIPAKAVAEIR